LNTPRRTNRQLRTGPVGDADEKGTRRMRTPGGCPSVDGDQKPGVVWEHGLTGEHGEAAPRPRCADTNTSTTQRVKSARGSSVPRCATTQACRARSGWFLQTQPMPKQMAVLIHGSWGCFCLKLPATLSPPDDRIPGPCPGAHRPAAKAHTRGGQYQFERACPLGAFLGDRARPHPPSLGRMEPWRPVYLR